MEGASRVGGVGGVRRCEGGRALDWYRACTWWRRTCTSIKKPTWEARAAFDHVGSLARGTLGKAAVSLEKVVHV